MNIKSIIAAAALTLAAAAPAQAEILATSETAVGGEIILTDGMIDDCTDVGLLAINRQPTGQTIFGCWLISKHLIFVKWLDEGDVWSYEVASFEVLIDETAPAAAAREMQL